MTEYSYSDLVKMQDQAIRRVREMQERARLTVKENPLPPLDNSTSFDNSPSGDRLHNSSDLERTKGNFNSDKNLPSGDRFHNSSDLERSKNSPSGGGLHNSTHQERSKNSPSGDRLNKSSDLERSKGNFNSDKNFSSGDRLHNGSDLERSKILLPLIMLLSREGADNILMIALLYILA